MKSYIYFLIVISSLQVCKVISNQPLVSEVDLQGHRGARGLRPENTWPAFEFAIQNKMSTLELDTILTKDNQVIIHHDSDSNPDLCLNEKGEKIITKSIYELTSNELESYDCGSKLNPKFPEQVLVPKARIEKIGSFFEKVLEYEKLNKTKPVLFNIETKFPNDSESKVSDEILEKHITELIFQIQKYKLESRTTIQSFYLPAIPIIQSKNKKIKTSALFAPSMFQGAFMQVGIINWFGKTIFEKANSLHVDIISPYSSFVTPEFVKLNHEKNIQVIPWTVNSEKEMIRLLDCGVDGMISDYPDKLSKTYNAWKLNKK